jgi:hypothetical protein
MGKQPILSYERKPQVKERRSLIPPVSVLQLLIIFWLLVVVFIVYALLQYSWA